MDKQCHIKETVQTINIATNYCVNTTRTPTIINKKKIDANKIVKGIRR